MTTQADAATCTPYNSAGTVCDSSVARHNLVNGEPSDAYKTFIFRTDTYNFNNAQFDANWAVGPTNLGGGAVTRVPRKIGAVATLPNIGAWTDPQGSLHEIDVKLTVVSTNGGFVSSYSGLGISGVQAGTANAGNTVSALEPQPTDNSKRTGIELKSTFYYSGTTTTVPSTFKGLVGFGDIDGTSTSDPANSESIEFTSGFDGIWTSNNTQLVAFGQNGVSATSDNPAQLDTSSAAAQQHMVTGAFSGPTMTIRYSQGITKSTYASMFAVPLLNDPNRYTVNAQAVDDKGAVIKSTWKVIDNLLVGGAYSLTPPSIAGYSYVGLGSGSSPLSGTITGGATTRTITLVYTKLYTLSYDANGGSGTMSSWTGTASQQATVGSNMFTRTGYTFKSWNTKADGTGTSYAPGAKLNLAADTVMYAQWSPVIYNVKFVTNTDTTINPQNVPYGTPASKPSTPSKTGYTFDGWFADAKFTIPYDFSKPVTGDVIIYAKWDINVYKVSFVTDGGTVINPESVNYNDSASEPNNPVKDGFKFNGWYTDKSYKTVYDFDNPVISDTSVYAQWIPVVTSLPNTGFSNPVQYKKIIISSAIMFAIIGLIVELNRHLSIIG